MIQPPKAGYLNGQSLEDASVEQIVQILEVKFKMNGRPKPSAEHVQLIARRYHHRLHSSSLNTRRGPLRTL